jgi:glucosamine--fructose-6-phosphate aminotransferase (isomerizing)
MRAEIDEQPDRWRELVRAWPVDAAAALVLAAEQVVLAGRGTSDHAATYGQYLVQVVLGKPAYLATPSVTTVFGRETYRPTTAVIALSQSGQSPDLVATVMSARRCGAPTVAITNDPASPLARAADVHVPLLVGTENAVAATKSYTAELLALYLVVAASTGARPAEIEAEVGLLSLAAEEVLASGRPGVLDVAHQVRDVESAMVIGRGYGLATARESALKLTETCSLSASGWSAADAKHGPLAQVRPGTPVFCLLGAEAGRESVRALVPDLLVRGARVWTVEADVPAPPSGSVPSASGGAVSPSGGVASASGGAVSASGSVAPASGSVASPPGSAAGSAGVLRVPWVPDQLMPLLEILPFQQLALELALRRGLDPDRPIGLTKVTLTR